MAEVLERGEIAFLYRPRVETPVARGIEDVQRFFIVLAPGRGRPLRRIAVGRKRLPEVALRQRFWGYVDRIAADPATLTEDIEREAYWTKTRGLRLQPGPRLAGAGSYVLARHGGHTHLAYALGTPREPGPVQTELGIAREASYVVAVFNRGLPASFAAPLGERRFAPAHPDLLDLLGAELVLIGADDDVERELGIEVEPSREAAERRELVDQLRGDRDRGLVSPLHGAWR